MKWREYLNPFLRCLEPTQSLFSFYMVDLALIKHTINNDLYATDPSLVGWSCVKSRMIFYRQMLDVWASTIHSSFGFQGGLIVSPPTGSLQVSLALNYYSAHILLNRPCLNNLTFGKKHVSRDSGEQYANRKSFDCLQASLGVIAQLPDQPDLVWWYQVPQYWDILHILAQSLAIILLSIPAGPTSAKSEGVQLPLEPAVWASVTKSLCWLHCLGGTSESACRGFQFFNNCVQRMVPSRALDLKGKYALIDPSRTACDSISSKARDMLEAKAMSPPEDGGAGGDIAGQRNVGVM